jgi:hypothetical protein
LTTNKGSSAFAQSNNTPNSPSSPYPRGGSHRHVETSLLFDIFNAQQAPKDNSAENYVSINAI